MQDEEVALSMRTRISMSMSISMNTSMSRGIMVHCNNNNNSNSNSNSTVCSCKHSPSATLDLLILILVLFSGAFLLSSYLSYIFNSLSLLLPSLSLSLPLSYLLPCLLFFALCLAAADFCCRARSRRCHRSSCKGLKNAMEFDLQIHRFSDMPHASAEFDKLPWKGGTEANPDYECLRSELRKMAPPNGRALLLFRAPCGCPVAKLEASGPKKPKRHKRTPPSTTLNGGGDHR